MELFMLAIVVAMAIKGAGKQAWQDGRAAAQKASGSGTSAASGSGGAGSKTAGAGSSRQPGRSSVRAATTGAAIGRLIGGTAAVGAAVGQGLKTGWRDGWRRGRQAVEERTRERETRRDEEAQSPGCGKCGHGTDQNPSQVGCDCKADGCMCRMPEKQDTPTGGGAVGQCSECGHLYREGRKADCACQSTRCPCRAVGARNGTQTPVRKATLSKAGA